MRDAKFHIFNLLYEFGRNLSFFKVNPFVPNAPFLYPLKTSENLAIF